MHFLAIIGSLRKGSWNRKTYEAVRTLLPEGVTIEEAQLGDIPPFNQDVLDEAVPPSVAKLAEQVAAADGVIFISPEYNYSIPGFMKNALDWVSRLPDQPFRDKPVAIMGASPYRLGTVRMQYHLRQVLLFLDTRQLSRPEVMISFADKLFDEEGKLIDDNTREIIQMELEAFCDWIKRLTAGSEAMKESIKAEPL